MSLALALLAAAATAARASSEPSCGLAIPPTATPLGTLASRPARFAPPSGWSVGGETLDRSFTNFSAWSPFLGPLGVTAVRMQAGWARCDPRGDGAYEWAWLDEAVVGSLAVGVEPWLQLSFGNPAVAGGGSAAVGSPLPVGDAALTAWDAWTRAAVARYAPLLARGAGTWEIWNEPNFQHINATAYADFALRTAATVRAVAPLARVRVGVLAGVDVYYATKFAARVAQTPGGSALLDEFTYHPCVPHTTMLRAALPINRPPRPPASPAPHTGTTTTRTRATRVSRRCARRSTRVGSRACRSCRARTARRPSAAATAR